MSTVHLNPTDEHTLQRNKTGAWPHPRGNPNPFTPPLARPLGVSVHMAAKELRRERQQEDEDAFEFDLENPFTSPDDEPIARLLIAEAEHSASVPDAASAARRGATGFIAKVRGLRAAVVCSALCPFFTRLLFVPVASSVS